jgi:rod shape determining protein RodA
MATDFFRQMPGNERGADRASRVAYLLHIDLPLLVMLFLLSLIGLVVLYSANDHSLVGIEKQAFYMLLGFVAMLLMAQISHYTLRHTAFILYGLTIALLLAVEFFGVGAKGAQRWLAIPGLPRFQPSELAKLAIPLTLASYFERRNLPPRFKHVVWALIIMAVPVILIAAQPDLGTALLIAASGFSVLFIAGLSWWYIIGALTAAIPAGFGMWFFIMHDYQRQRLLMLFNPEADKWGAGWNIIQSTTAIGSGGFTGKGWLQGTQSHLDFLPEGHTDFIIAVLSEEFGFIGVLVLLTLYLAIVARCLWISSHGQDTFGRLLGATLAFTFFFYVFVNMGMVSGILPVVGVPLPLISQGGTAIISLMTGFGILMAIATDRKTYTR